MKDIILFGMQGSGKGTQADILIDTYGFTKLETGRLLRQVSVEESELGKKVKDIMAQGKLVDDTTMIEILHSFVKTNKDAKGFLFDGYPRTIRQHESLVSILNEFERDYFGLFIDITQEEAIRRIATRKICPTCKKNYPVFYKNTFCETCKDVELIQRQDDTDKQTIMKRIELYKDETVPIIELLDKQGKCATINGEQPIESVSHCIKRTLATYNVL